MRRGWVSLCVLMGVAWGVSALGIATGPPQPKADPRTVKQLAEALHAENYATREGASAALMRLAPEHLPEVEEALSKESDEEAASRLTDAALHLFLKQITSFEGSAVVVGVKLNPEHVRLKGEEEPRLALAVAELQPGFPAAEVLRVGDRVVGVDGKGIVADPGLEVEAFRQRINTGHKPGDVVRVTLMRGDKLREESVRLAGLNTLGKENLSAALQEWIAARNSAAASYLRTLRTGVRGKALVVTGGTPEESPGPEGWQEIQRFEGPVRIEGPVPIFPRPPIPVVPGPVPPATMRGLEPLAPGTTLRGR